MPFNTLLLSCCLLPGKNSFEEKEVKISVEAKEDEEILLFSIDEKSNPRCKLRQLLRLDKANMKICDLIVFYAKGSERVICFIELKGSNDLRTAKEQVINTFKYFKDSLQDSSSPQNFTAKAYIKLDGAAPLETDQYQQELKNAFGQSNYDINRNEDISQFLRGVLPLLKGKTKGKKGR